MRLVVVESPYAADTPEGVAENVRYARRCLADCLKRGEAPFASHLLYTQESVLDDGVPEQRALGIQAGLDWGARANVVCFYIDRGVSTGMRYGYRAVQLRNRLRRVGPKEQPVEIRSLVFKDEEIDARTWIAKLEAT